MTTRFTETDKWEDSWFRKLKLQEKVLFLYICDKCNSAGFWEIDLELASIFTGIGAKSILAAFEGLSRAYLRHGGFVWLRDFIRQQRNYPLNPQNNAHKQIIGQLEFHSDNDVKFLEELEKMSPKRAPNEGPCNSNSKGNSNSSGNGNSKVKGADIPDYMESPEFKTAWAEWIQHRIEIRHKLTPSTIRMQLKKFMKYHEEEAIDTIHLSIEKGWQGLFPERIKDGRQTTQTNQRQSQNTTTGPQSTASDRRDRQKPFVR